ncbi:MAG: Gfo/Idh/MocA family oxidoreductase [Verrucomicrobia bacterium]|nr:Gfo/Idh/MocA family oxidoreductase [Verrucomicrobiota bacterium]MDA1005203.1 Gfo/Idh/MocA family oxidoreductase [Verrucomicrobiota bacterium]
MNNKEQSSENNNLIENLERAGLSRRGFLHGMGGMGAFLGMGGLAGNAAAAEGPKDADGKVIPGFEKNQNDPNAAKGWQQFSDRKIRVGIAGNGLCSMGSQFSFQKHPNVEVVAVSDLIPSRCAALANACGCQKTYPSCEEMIKDDNIEAIFVATDAPSHARLSVAALEKGKHVAACVPAVFGSLEDADMLFEAVKKSGRKYMMFETSAFHADVYANHKHYQAGDFGKIIYSEGEYYHYFGSPIGGYNPKTKNVDSDGWRKGLPPQWYPTHSNAYYISVTGGSFTEVSCMGMPSVVPHLQATGNDYKNSFGSEVALFRTSEGGMSRMAVCWDMPGAGGEQGRIYGQKKGGGNVATDRPPLPPGVAGGGHGGSHGQLMNEFVDAVLRDRNPWVDVAQALNMTVPGIVAHQSALKDGELLKIPQYKL